MELNLLNDVRVTCRALSIGRTSLYAAIRDGRLRAVKRGKRTLISRDEIERFAASLPELR